MSVIQNNEISSQNHLVDDLILRGKNIVIEGESGTLPLTGAAIGGSQNRVFILEPAIVASTGNRYKTWPEIQAIIGSINGTKEIIFVGSATINTVADFTDCILRSFDATPAVISVTNNVTGLWRVLDNVDLQFNNSNPNASFAVTQDTAFQMLRGAKISKTGQAAIGVVAPQTLLVEMYGESSIESGSIFNQEGTVTVRLYDNAEVSNNFCDGFDGIVNVNYAKLSLSDYQQNIAYSGTINLNQIHRDTVRQMMSSPVGVKNTSGQIVSDAKFIRFESGAETNINQITTITDTVVDGRTVQIENRIGYDDVVILYNAGGGSQNLNVGLYANPSGNTVLFYGDIATFVVESGVYVLRGIVRRGGEYRPASGAGPDFQARLTDRIIRCDAVAITNINLPSIQNKRADEKQFPLIIRNNKGTSITATPFGLEQIDGSNSPVTINAGQSLNLVTDGSQWLVF